MPKGSGRGSSRPCRGLPPGHCRTHSTNTNARPGPEDPPSPGVIPAKPGQAPNGPPLSDVIPAKAGIHAFPDEWRRPQNMDPRLRGDDIVVMRRKLTDMRRCPVPKASETGQRPDWAADSRRYITEGARQTRTSDQAKRPAPLGRHSREGGNPRLPRRMAQASKHGSPPARGWHCGYAPKTCRYAPMSCAESIGDRTAALLGR
jgi:hypothetical protein